MSEAIKLMEKVIKESENKGENKSVSEPRSKKQEVKSKK